MMTKNEKNDNTPKRLTIHDPIINEEQDILNRKSIAKKILERLKNYDCPPVLGLYGGWGTGKTSVLNLLEEINKKEEKRLITERSLIISSKNGIQNLAHKRSNFT